MRHIGQIRVRRTLGDAPVETVQQRNARALAEIAESSAHAARNPRRHGMTRNSDLRSLTADEGGVRADWLRSVKCAKKKKEIAEAWAWAIRNKPRNFVVFHSVDEIKALMKEEADAQANQPV